MIPNDSIEVKICTDDKKRRMSGNKNRLPCSAVCQENENLGNEEGNNSTNIIASDSSKGSPDTHESNVATTRSSTSKKTKVTCTPCNAKILIFGSRKNKSWILVTATVIFLFFCWFYLVI